MEESELVISPKQTVISKSAQLIAGRHRIIRFRGRAMLEVHEPYPHFRVLHKDEFEQIAYPLLGGIGRSKMNDIFAYVINVAEDLTPYERYICFGVPLSDIVVDADTDLSFLAYNKAKVWDMQTLTWVPEIHPDQCVWRSPHPPVLDNKEPIPFVMELAGGSKDVYDDIMQSLAPLIMDKKPDGVIWWVGSGANGKSTLMDAIYRIFPGHLASINLKRLTDGRDTPSLNGMLANVVKENSEGRIDDTQVYKSIGTHENFRVHKFHSQDDIEIRGNMHHIFSANQIPAFNDKGHSTQRRTFIVPFRQQFASDPTFEARTFTPELFGRLIAEMTRYALRIKKQQYRYKWSAITRSAKADYDKEASNAEEYVKSLVADGIVAFTSFNPVKMDYENWCADNGYVPLGVSNIRRAFQAVGFGKVSIRTEDGPRKIYALPDIDGRDLQQYHITRPGLYTTVGFEREEPEPEPETPEFEKDTYTDVVKGRW